jgi:hypothetical protein
MAAMATMLASVSRSTNAGDPLVSKNTPRPRGRVVVAMDGASIDAVTGHDHALLSRGLFISLVGG